MKKVAILMVLLTLALTALGVGAQEPVVLTMGSWRTEDINQWENILAVFEAEHPEIDVRFEPTLNTEYNTQIETALQGGIGPDLITCRPFDIALLLHQAGYLADISDLPGLEHFSDVALSAWSTDDGAATYCVPMASVIHGFIYNKDVFDELGLEEPTTESEFFAVLDALQEAGHTPLAITTKDSWTTQTMGFNNIWPNFAGGEEGRQGLINGTMSFTDEGFVNAMSSVARWGDYMPEGHESIGYADAQQMFPLGLAAIYPSGSWEIPLFNELADFEMGAFPPYRPDDATECWIDDHVDIAVGMNANTPHPEEARVFLEWLTTQEFAQVFSDNQPGFFSLADHPVELSDPLAAEFLSWREECGSTIRVFDQFLSREEPSGNTMLADLVYQVVQGNVTPEDATQQIADGLAEWYEAPEAAAASS